MRRTTRLGRKVGVLLAGTSLVAVAALTIGPAIAGAASEPSGASGATGATGATGSNRPHRPGLTDAQKTCLTEHGITLPTPGAHKDSDAKPRTRDHSGPPDQATRDQWKAQADKLKAAAEACDIKLPHFGGGRGGHRPALTDAQKTCLTEHGITLPTPGARKDSDAKPRTRDHSGPPDQATRDQWKAQADKLKAAAEACGIKGPGDGAHRPGMGAGPGAGRGFGLTDAQKTCLSEHGVTLPTPGAAGGWAKGDRPAGPPDQATRDQLRAKVKQWIDAAKACGIQGPRGMGGPGGPGGPQSNRATA